MISSQIPAMTAIVHRFARRCDTSSADIRQRTTGGLRQAAAGVQAAKADPDCAVVARLGTGEGNQFRGSDTRSAEAKKAQARKMIRELRPLGYRVEAMAPTPTA